MSARYVCSLWWNICKDPLMWHTIHISLYGIAYLCVRFFDLGINDTFYNQMHKIFQHAIDQSRSHLQHFNIEGFVTDPLFKYIANSTSQLQRLRLAHCEAITDKGLRRVVKKLPLLEELDISFNWLSEVSLEVIGIYCPYLVTLKFNKKVYEDPIVKHDDEAFAVAKTMQKLRHLEKLTNDGLLAILEGCHHLESLDLQGCFNVDLQGSLGERCAKQIKDLRLPDDYIAEDLYEDDDDGDD